MLPIFVLNQKVIDGGDMVGSITPAAVDISGVTSYAVHAFWTGTPAGNIIVEGSNDNSNFVAVSTTAAGGAAGNVLVNVPNAAYRYVRVKYVLTSSTGVLNAYLSGKQ